MIKGTTEKRLVKSIEKATHGILTRFPGKFMAAGGKLIDILNETHTADGDIDLFLLSGLSKDVNELKEYLWSMGFEEAHISDDKHTILFKKNQEYIPQGESNNLSNTDIHLITFSPGEDIKPLTPTEVLDRFDMSACRIGVSDGKVITGDGFETAYKTKTNSLRLDNDDLWLQALVRAVKYSILKGFDKIDESIFKTLEIGSRSVEINLEDMDTYFRGIEREGTFFSLVNYRSICFLPNSSASNFRAKNNKTIGWRKRYNDEDMSKAERFLKRTDSMVLMPIIVSTLSRMIINSDLKFPLKLLEYEHEGVISDRFARELAHAVYLNSGSDARYFDGKYEPKKHFPESVEFDSVLRKPSSYDSIRTHEGKRTIKTYLEASYFDFVMSEIENNRQMAEYALYTDCLDFWIITETMNPDYTQRLMDAGSAPRDNKKRNRNTTQAINFLGRVLKGGTYGEKGNGFWYLLGQFSGTGDHRVISLKEFENEKNKILAVEKILIENKWFDREPDYFLTSRQEHDKENIEVSF